MDHLDELVRACRVLFGPAVGVDLRFLQAIEHSALKQAYRKRALATHPDRFVGLGPRIQEQHAALFREVSDAYQRLNKYLNWKSVGSRFQGVYVNPQTNAWRRATASRSAPPNDSPFFSSFYAPQRAPRWPLRTGEFLYFSGVVSWKYLISALVWQRRQRQCLGEIARRWGWLSEAEIMGLLMDRRRGERLGEILLRHRLISRFQLGMLLRHQERNQRPLGRFFIEQGLMSEWRLQQYLHDLRTHNLKWGQTTFSPFCSR